MELIRKLGVDPEADEDALEAINQVYIESRYPADFGLLPGGIPSIETIEKFTVFAADLYTFAEEVIREESD